MAVHSSWSSVACCCAMLSWTMPKNVSDIYAGHHVPGPCLSGLLLIAVMSRL